MSNKNIYEIDLVVLFSRILKILKRNYLIIIISIGLGIGFSFYKRIKKQVIYETRYVMVVQKDDLHVTTEIIENINDIVKTDKEVAAKKLGLTDTIIKKVLNIDFQIDEAATKDDMVKTNLVCEHMPIDSAALIGEAIEKYINEIPYFEKRITQEKIQLKNQIREYKNKIQETDSMQALFMDAYLKNDKMIYINPDETQASLRQQKLKLIEDKDELEKELENLNVLYIINHFTVNTELSVYSLAGYILLFFILGLIIIVLKELIRLAKNR